MLRILGDGFAALLGLGLEVQKVNPGQMALRTVLVYAFTLALVRFGSKRFLAQEGAFDAVVGIMLGSIMSRAINGSAPFVPTLAAGVALLGVHWLLAVLALHVSWLGPLVKGNAIRLIQDGKIQQAGVRKAELTTADLEEALRLRGKQPDLSQVQLSNLERNGRISLVPRQPAPRVVTLSIADGVQTVRIELE